MTVPTVLNVGGVFQATHKYGNSVAMLLHFCEWQTDQTGSVHENGTHARFFDINDLAAAYTLVSEWIADEEANWFQAKPVLWSEARQMIDILFEGRYWIITEDAQGFVEAQGYETYESAWDAFSLVEQDYMKSSGDFDPCGVCGEYGHRDKEHDEDLIVVDETRSGSSYLNEAGEPLMTAAQARFEAYLDDEPRDPYDD